MLWVLVWPLGGLMPPMARVKLQALLGLDVQVIAESGKWNKSDAFYEPDPFFF